LRTVAAADIEHDSAHAAPELAPKIGAMPAWMWTISQAIAL